MDELLLDTNVVFSLLYYGKSLLPLLEELQAGRAQVLLLQETVDEMEGLLRRRPFPREVWESFRDHPDVSVVRAPGKAVIRSRDTKDQFFLDAVDTLVRARRITHALTGDADLLTPEIRRAYPILTPAEYLQRVSRQPP